MNSQLHAPAQYRTLRLRLRQLARLMLPPLWLAIPLRPRRARKCPRPLGRGWTTTRSRRPRRPSGTKRPCCPRPKCSVRAAACAARYCPPRIRQRTGRASSWGTSGGDWGDAPMEQTEESRLAVVRWACNRGPQCARGLQRGGSARCAQGCERSLPTVRNTLTHRRLLGCLPGYGVGGADYGGAGTPPADPLRCTRARRGMEHRSAWARSPSSWASSRRRRSSSAASTGGARPFRLRRARALTHYGLKVERRPPAPNVAGRWAQRGK